MGFNLGFKGLIKLGHRITSDPLGSNIMMTVINVFMKVGVGELKKEF
jgi:hypothetical protein